MKRQSFCSIRAKLTAVFVVIILFIMAITVILHTRAMNTIRSSIYEEMLNNVAFFQSTLDNQIDNIARLQIDFFQDRKLAFLSGTDSLLDDYERREAYLSVQERLRSVTGISDLVADGTLYFPRTGYYITESRIGLMNEQQKKEMNDYLGVGNSELHSRGGQFFIASTGEVRTGFSSRPNQLFVIRFSSEEIIGQLGKLAEGRAGGAFLYDEKNQVFLGSKDDSAGMKVLRALARDQEGSYLPTQRIVIEGQVYLALVQKTLRNAVIVQYTPDHEATAWIRSSWLIAGTFLLAMVLFAVFFIMYVQRTVHQPLTKLSKAFERVENGVLTEHIHHEKGDEFSYIYKRFNDMEDYLRRLIDEVYVQKNLAQKAQMKQLQAQINPHFLYNSFFILSRRIHKQDIEGAEELANHLGNYFKYLSRDQSDVIPLSDEVAHARSYAAIQGARFAARMRIEFSELPEKWGSLQVPRLIIQPLLENAFKYGLENKSEDALLRVSFFEAERGILHVIVEDNGESGADPDVMQKAIEEENPDIVSGMANIHKRLQIYYHGQGGLRIHRSDVGGIAVTILLPGEQETQG